MLVVAVAVPKATHLVPGHILLQTVGQVVEVLDILETVQQHLERQIGAVVVEVLAQILEQLLPELAVLAALASLSSS
jgi:hypothetical protein